MTIANFVLPDGRTCVVTAKDDLSLMEAARQSNVPGIVADCGGGAQCATCHVHVAPEWMEAAGPPTPHETMMLELAPGRDERSRLSCQITMTPALDGIVVHVPEEQA